MEELAQVYARALFEVAREQGKLDELHEQLAQFADALEANRELAVFFFSPYFSTREKQDGLERMLDGADESFLNFLKLLIENHRMPVIFRIRAQLRAAVGGGEPHASRRDHERHRARPGHRGGARPDDRRARRAPA